MEEESKAEKIDKVEKETVVNSNSSTTDDLSGKDKENCMIDEKDQVTEEKGGENQQQVVDIAELEEKCISVCNRSITQLITTHQFHDSEDEAEIPCILKSDDPKQRILWAAEKNEIDVVRQLLEEETSLVNAIDEDLYTPLHRACSNNHTEIVKLLLSCGADLEARTEDGWCPLHCACRWDSVEAASLLLQNGANVNATSKGGLSPLHLAAANSSGRRTLELLLWHPHIDGSLKAENGDTAYDIACRTSNTLLRLFELLEESGNTF